MCIATPMKIVKVEGPRACVSLGQVTATVNIQLIPKAKKGDYVLVHAGMAIEKVNAAKAKELIALLNELSKKV